MSLPPTPELAPLFNIDAIKEAAALNEDQAAALAEGLAGSDIELELTRQQFTAVQRAVELALAPSVSKIRYSGPAVIYNTQYPLTPIYRPAHPRAESIRALFGTHTQNSNIRSTDHPVQSMVSGIHLREFLTTASQAEIKSIIEFVRVAAAGFTVHSDPTAPIRNVMAFSSTLVTHDDRNRTRLPENPFMFEASQMRNTNSDSPGKIIFGKAAESTFLDVAQHAVVRDEHHEDLRKNLFLSTSGI
ncbi:hypothetical protein COV82_01800 [Candidatus Peregrinibacteria bacterium CG11_big_fil_rev_8_21_14_0_20_46_8]|nr:MAG: hypothetical protein COV82_01800 [Candidatus Peregrinibacteria bacterium CG11_big_fil_rev_8_21_14_0_20_46_8]